MSWTNWFHAGLHVMLLILQARGENRLWTLTEKMNYLFLCFRVMHECFLLLAAFPGQYLISPYLLHCQRRGGL